MVKLEDLKDNRQHMAHVIKERLQMINAQIDNAESHASESGIYPSDEAQRIDDSAVKYFLKIYKILDTMQRIK